MPTLFPGAIDTGASLPFPSAGDLRNNPSLSSGQDNQNDALIATETKVGFGASNQTPASNKILLGTGAGQSQWAAITAPYFAASTGTGGVVLATDPTVTNAVLNTPIITNPVLNTDSVIGYTDADDGTVFGMSIAGGTIASAAIAAGAITTSKLATGSNFEPATVAENPYKFSVWQNGAQSIAGGGGGVKVKLDSTTFDTSSNFDIVTNHRFVAPIAGFYQFSAACGLSSLPDGAAVSCALYKNGSNTKDGTQYVNGGSTAGIAVVSGLIQLAATDYVELFIFNGNAGALSLTAGASNQVYMDGFLVSAS